MLAWLLVAAVAACSSRPAEPESPVSPPPPPEAPLAGAAVEPDASVAPAAAVSPASDAGPAPAEAPPEPVVIAPPTPELAGAETCAVETTIDVGTGGEKLRSLDIALGPRGGLVAWEHDTAHVSVVPIDLTGATTGPARVEEMPLGHRIEHLSPLGDRFVLFTQSVCDDEPRKSRTVYCTFARGFAADGAGLGPAAEMHDSWPASHVVQDVSTASDLRLVWNDMGSWFRLYRYRIDENGTVAQELVDATREGDAMFQGYCGSDGERIVALHTEDRRVFRTSAAGDVQIVGLGNALDVIGCHVEGDEVTMLFAPWADYSGKRLRPRSVRVGLDGKLRSRPRVIGRGETPGAPFVETIAAKVERDAFGGALTFSRSNWAQEAVGAPLVLSTEGKVLRTPEFGKRESVVWSGDRFLAAAGYEQERSWKIAVHRVRCTR
jgi:hypothetical protein